MTRIRHQGALLPPPSTGIARIRYHPGNRPAAMIPVNDRVTFTSQDSTMRGVMSIEAHGWLALESHNRDSGDWQFARHAPGCRVTSSGNGRAPNSYAARNCPGQCAGITRVYSVPTMHMTSVPSRTLEREIDFGSCPGLHITGTTAIAGQRTRALAIRS